MKKETIEVTVTRAVIADIADAYALQDWCRTQVESGAAKVYCRITNHLTGGYAIEVGGATADEHSVQFGDTVSWDGSRFTVTKAAA